MMEAQARMEYTLARAQRALQILEEQVASFGSLYVPAHLLIQLEEKRAEVARLEATLAEGSAVAQVRAPAAGACPYPGLVAFGAEDGDRFYGRAGEIDDLLGRLQRQRFFAIIGPSGSGKSSLVFAGLLPKLQDNRLFASDFWLVRAMRPGAQPCAALEQALGGDTADLEGRVAALLAADGAAKRVLLVIDQLEELWAQADRGEQARFVERLCALRQVKACALIVTLRADFYPQLMHSALWPLTEGERLELAPLRGALLRRAIEQPARDVGVELEPELLDQLMIDAADEPGALPLLQEMMRQLWAKMEDHTLTLSAYQRLRSRDSSGLAAAITNLADATLSELTPAQQQIARRIFLRLVQVSDNGPDTRRQVSRASLRGAGGSPELFDSTLAQLTENRLVIASGDDAHDPMIDLAHETLIAGWHELQTWLKESRAGLIIQQRLAHDAAEWLWHGRDPSFLYGGSRLADAQGYRADNRDELSAEEDDFLDASAAREIVRQRSRYLGQAAGGALGAALGYGLGFATLGAAMLSTDLAPALFMSMFPIGEMIGLCIGIALWIYRARPGLRGPAGALFGALASGILYPFYQVNISGGAGPQHFFAGACIGAGVGLGAGLARDPWRRLMGVTLGGVVGCALGYLAGGIAAHVWVILIGGLALGGLTGLGFLMTAVETNERVLG
jgi:hypothetical protein